MNNWDQLVTILAEYGLRKLLEKILNKLENKFDQNDNAMKTILDETMEWKINNPYMGKEIV